MNRASRIVVALSAAALCLTACGSEEVNQPTTTNAAAGAGAATPATGEGSCRAPEPFSVMGGAERVVPNGGEVAEKIAESVPLPSGMSLVDGRLHTDSDEPGRVYVAVILCGGDIDSADALRPLATQFAKAFRTSDLGDSIFAFYVSNFDSYNSTDLSGEVKLKDPDFPAHLWNGKPSPEAETEHWEVIAG